jgi:hypothetical protein
MKHLQQFESFSFLKENLISTRVMDAIGKINVDRENSKYPKSAEPAVIEIESPEWKKLVSALSTVNPAPKVSSGKPPYPKAGLISFNPPSMGPSFGMSLSNIIYDTKDGLALKLWISFSPAMKRQISDIWRVSGFTEENGFSKEDYFIMNVDPNLNTTAQVLKKSIQETLNLKST